MKITFVAVAVPLLLAGCGEPPPQKDAVRAVRAMKVGDLDGMVKRSFPGRATATQEVDLAFRVSGPLVTRPVNVGDELEEGGLIAQIDPRDFEVALASAESSLARAKANLAAMEAGARPEELQQLKAAVDRAQSTYDRSKSDLKRAEELAPTGAISRAELDRHRNAFARAEADLRTAKEALNIGETGAREEDIDAKKAEIGTLTTAVDEAKNQLDDTNLRASFAGTIVATYVENFENVRSGQQIARLIDKTKIEFEVNIPETLISLVPYVTDISVKFDAFPDVEIPAEIKEIGTEASATTRTFPVTVIMDQPEEAKILPGMAGRVSGKAREPEEGESVKLVIPVTALFSPKADEKSFVWVIDGTDTVHRREVTLGKLVSGGYQITDGLKPDELIATAGVHFLVEGQKVKPIIQ